MCQMSHPNKKSRVVIDLPTSDEDDDVDDYEEAKKEKEKKFQEGLERAMVVSEKLSSFYEGVGTFVATSIDKNTKTKITRIKTEKHSPTVFYHLPRLTRVLVFGIYDYFTHAEVVTFIRAVWTKVYTRPMYKYLMLLYDYLRHRARGVPTFKNAPMIDAMIDELMPSRSWKSVYPTISELYASHRSSWCPCCPVGYELYDITYYCHLAYDGNINYIRALNIKCSSEAITSLHCTWDVPFRLALDALKGGHLDIALELARHGNSLVLFKCTSFMRNILHYNQVKVLDQIKTAWPTIGTYCEHLGIDRKIAPFSCNTREETFMRYHLYYPVTTDFINSIFYASKEGLLYAVKFYYNKILQSRDRPNVLARYIAEPALALAYPDLVEFCTSQGHIWDNVMFNKTVTQSRDNGDRVTNRVNFEFIKWFYEKYQVSYQLHFVPGYFDSMVIYYICPKTLDYVFDHLHKDQVRNMIDTRFRYSQWGYETHKVLIKHNCQFPRRTSIAYTLRLHNTSSKAEAAEFFRLLVQQTWALVDDDCWKEACLTGNTLALDVMKEYKCKLPKDVFIRFIKSNVHISIEWLCSNYKQELSQHIGDCFGIALDHGYLETIKYLCIQHNAASWIWLIESIKKRWMCIFRYLLKVTPFPQPPEPYYSQLFSEILKVQNPDMRNPMMKLVRQHCMNRSGFSFTQTIAVMAAANARPPLSSSSSPPPSSSDSDSDVSPPDSDDDDDDYVDDDDF